MNATATATARDAAYDAAAAIRDTFAAIAERTVARGESGEHTFPLTHWFSGEANYDTDALNGLWRLGMVVRGGQRDTGRITEAFVAKYYSLRGETPPLYNVRYPNGMSLGPVSFVDACEQRRSGNRTYGTSGIGWMVRADAPTAP